MTAVVSDFYHGKRKVRPERGKCYHTGKTVVHLNVYAQGMRFEYSLCS